MGGTILAPAGGGGGGGDLWGAGACRAQHVSASVLEAGAGQGWLHGMSPCANVLSPGLCAMSGKAQLTRPAGVDQPQLKAHLLMLSATTGLALALGSIVAARKRPSTANRALPEVARGAMLCSTRGRHGTGVGFHHIHLGLMYWRRCTGGHRQACRACTSLSATRTGKPRLRGPQRDARAGSRSCVSSHSTRERHPASACPVLQAHRRGPYSRGEATRSRSTAQ